MCVCVIVLFQGEEPMGLLLSRPCTPKQRCVDSCCLPTTIATAAAAATAHRFAPRALLGRDHLGRAAALGLAAGLLLLRACAHERTGRRVRVMVQHQLLSFLCRTTAHTRPHLSAPRAALADLTPPATPCPRGDGRGVAMATAGHRRRCNLYMPTRRTLPEDAAFFLGAIVVGRRGAQLQKRRDQDPSLTREL